MIPEIQDGDMDINLDAEYQLADRDSMRRAIIRRCYAAERQGSAGASSYPDAVFEYCHDGVLVFRMIGGLIFETTLPDWMQWMPVQYTTGPQTHCADIISIYGPRSPQSVKLYAGTTFHDMLKQCLQVAAWQMQ